ncbi:hypothetical protein DSUL_50287 [Desulfovibrionales bacterium]
MATRCCPRKLCLHPATLAKILCQMASRQPIVEDTNNYNRPKKIEFRITTISPYLGVKIYNTIKFILYIE